MSRASTFSFTEALTRLAFGDATPATAILSALSDGRWDRSRSDALAQLTAAVHALCDAGYSGDVKLWGKSATRSADATLHVGPLRQLTQADCVQFRLFTPRRDALWSGNNQGDEFADSFAAEVSVDGLDELCVDQADFNKFLAKAPKTRTTANIKLPDLSDADLKRWWDRLSDADRDLPQDDLHKRCEAAHPNNSIARQRVRALLPNRRPGPRRITPNSTA